MAQIYSNSYAGGICAKAEIKGYELSDSRYSRMQGILHVINCVSERAGLVHTILKDVSRNYSSVYVDINYNNSYWLYDLVNNIGQESGVGTDNYIDAWYMHDNAGCYLKGSNQDIVTLLNNWVTSNGPTEYKKWKYETIDGFAVPVFDE